MMRIGLIDVDGHNFPNLALMKISLSINRCLPSGKMRGWEAGV